MRQRRTAEAWRELVEGYPASGLTVPAYCSRRGICRASFYRWRGLLRGSARSRMPVAVPQPMAPQRAMPFIDLGTLRDATATSRLELRLDLGAGLVLQISRG